MGEADLQTPSLDNILAEFLDFQQNQKPPHQNYDVPMNVLDTGLYIPPQERPFNSLDHFIEHPEAIDEDDDDDDDNIFDLDFTSNTSCFDLPYQACSSERPSCACLGSPQMPPMVLCDVESPIPQFSYMQTDLFAQCPPVQSVNPRNLQLSEVSDPVAAPIEHKSPFRPASPVVCELEKTQAQPQPQPHPQPRVDSPAPTLQEEPSRTKPEQHPKFLVDKREDRLTARRSGLRYSSHSPSLRLATASMSSPESTPMSHSTRRKKPLFGSHRCDRLLPNGELCHKSFTRPYDLARHQETIHAEFRKMYRCDQCGDKSKTFSRMDALSRHVRIKHAH